MKTKGKKQLTDKEIFNSWIEKNRRRKERKHLGIEEMTIDFAKYYHKERLALLDVSHSFYCQRDIEMESKCDEQCVHCKEYYKPLEQ